MANACASAATNLQAELISSCCSPERVEQASVTTVRDKAVLAKNEITVDNFNTAPAICKRQSDDYHAYLKGRLVDPAREASVSRQAFPAGDGRRCSQGVWGAAVAVQYERL